VRHGAQIDDQNNASIPQLGFKFREIVRMLAVSMSESRHQGSLHGDNDRPILLADNLTLESSAFWLRRSLSLVKQSVNQA